MSEWDLGSKTTPRDLYSGHSSCETALSRLRPDIIITIGPWCCAHPARSSFFLCRCRYPCMKVFVLSLVALVMLSLHTYADPCAPSSLPSAPIPAAVKSPVFGIVDWSLAGSVVATRALDWTSTEECLRRPWKQCHEGELPSTLVKNKAGFAAYEAAVSAFSILAQYEMTRHGHRRVARLGQGVDVGFIGYTVMHNYRMAGLKR